MGSAFKAKQGDIVGSTINTTLGTDTQVFSFTGLVKPAVGLARWYPYVDSTVAQVYATIEYSPLSPVTLQLKKNGDNLGGLITIPQGGYKSDVVLLPNNPNSSLTTSDFLTVDIVSGDSGANIYVTAIVNYTPSDTVLPHVKSKATTTTLGSVKVGSGFTVSDDGALNVLQTPASPTNLGAVKVGVGLTISSTGVLSTVGAYPLASDTSFGVVKVGNNLSIDAYGRLNASAGVTGVSKDTLSGSIKGNVLSGAVLLKYTNLTPGFTFNDFSFLRCTTPPFSTVRFTVQFASNYSSEYYVDDYKVVGFVAGSTTGIIEGFAGRVMNVGETLLITAPLAEDSNLFDVDLFFGHQSELSSPNLNVIAAALPPTQDILTPASVHPIKGTYRAFLNDSTYANQYIAVSLRPGVPVRIYTTSTGMDVSVNLYAKNASGQQVLLASNENQTLLDQEAGLYFIPKAPGTYSDSAGTYTIAATNNKYWVALNCKPGDVGDCTLHVVDGSEVVGGYDETVTNNINTSAKIGGTGVFNGALTANNPKWVSVNLFTGYEIVISLEGQDTAGAGTLPDPTLHLFDASGVLLATNQDSLNRNPSLGHATTYTGKYFIQVSEATRSSGTYRLTVTGADPLSGVDITTASPTSDYFDTPRVFNFFAPDAADGTFLTWTAYNSLDNAVLDTGTVEIISNVGAITFTVPHSTVEPVTYTIKVPVLPTDNLGGTSPEVVALTELVSCPASITSGEPLTVTISGALPNAPFSVSRDGVFYDAGIYSVGATGSLTHSSTLWTAGLSGGAHTIVITFGKNGHSVTLNINVIEVALPDPHFNTVTLLLKTDNATNIGAVKDLSLYGRSVATGLTSLDTTNGKFSTSSLRFPGIRGIVTDIMPASNAITTPEYTIELWVYNSSNPSAFASNLGGTILSISGGGYSAVVSRLESVYDSNTGNFYILFDSNLGGLITHIPPVQPAPEQEVIANTWCHVALTQRIDSGMSINDWMVVRSLYVNGALVGDTAPSAYVYLDTSEIVVGAKYMYLGSNERGSHGSPFGGSIDSIRITNDVCRYTTSFTPPTSEFQESCSTPIWNIPSLTTSQSFSGTSSQASANILGNSWHMAGSTIGFSVKGGANWLYATYTLPYDIDGNANPELIYAGLNTAFLASLLPFVGCTFTQLSGGYIGALASPFEYHRFRSVGAIRLFDNTYGAINQVQTVAFNIGLPQGFTAGDVVRITLDGTAYFHTVTSTALLDIATGLVSTLIAGGWDSDVDPTIQAGTYNKTTFDYVTLYVYGADNTQVFTHSASLD